MFVAYIVQLVLRFALFAYAVIAFVLLPGQLNPQTHFSLNDGITFIDVVFVFMVADALTKLFPFSRISTGALKQFGKKYRQPSIIVKDGKDQLLAYIQTLKNDNKKLFQDIRAVIVNDIQSRRFREVIPVAIFWVVTNAVIAIVLYAFGWLTPETSMLWSLFYFLFDMICVVLWCPIQLWFMKNRCCTTCQIFNWDAIMAATPLVFAPCPFSFIILGMALIVLLKWELSFAMHPERFDERTNEALRCANCKDKLCQVRTPLTDSMPENISSILPDELKARLKNYVESKQENVDDTHADAEDDAIPER